MRTDNICLVKQHREAPSGGGGSTCLQLTSVKKLRWKQWRQLPCYAPVALALAESLPQGGGGQCLWDGCRGEAPRAETKGPGVAPVLLWRMYNSSTQLA